MQENSSVVYCIQHNQNAKKNFFQFLFPSDLKLRMSPQELFCSSFIFLDKNLGGHKYHRHFNFPPSAFPSLVLLAARLKNIYIIYIKCKDLFYL